MTQEVESEGPDMYICRNCRMPFTKEFLQRRSGRCPSCHDDRVRRNPHLYDEDGKELDLYHGEYGDK